MNNDGGGITKPIAPALASASSSEVLHERTPEDMSHSFDRLNMTPVKRAPACLSSIRRVKSRMPLIPRDEAMRIQKRG
jgi:hypothetical protein